MKTHYFFGFFRIKETENQIVLYRKWIWYPLHIFTLLIGFWGMYGFFANEMIWQGILAFFVFYWGLCGFFNYIKITINDEYIEKKNYPFPWLTNVKILTKNFRSAGESAITETKNTQITRVGGVNITTTLSKPTKSTTGYQVSLWANKTWSDGKITLVSIDFQDFTVGDYESADFLVLCLNKFKKKDDLQKDTQNN